MRHLLWIAVLASCTLAAPLTFAQSSSGTGSSSGTAYTPAPPNPENCGTPDTPKSCPPLPTTPLKHYRPKPASG